MPNASLTNMSEIGVITDIEPANLPVNAFTRAKNVRFDEGSVQRAPLFYVVQNSLSVAPAFCFGITTTTGGFSTVVLVSDTYDIDEFANGSVSNKNSFTVSATTEPFTGTSLANVTYINRVDRVPVFRLNGSNNNFVDLTNWPSNYRANSLRAFGDFLLALNTTEAGATFPTRVRWSNLALSNAVPDSWDATDLTKSAGFNDLVQMRTPIVDGLPLASNFIIYSSDQVWLADFVGGTFVFSFRKLFGDCGVINQNCITEVAGKHYVFGTDDIYVHDANSKNSIADQKVKKYVFSTIDTGKTSLCFTQHNKKLNEIYFCYRSNDDMSVQDIGADKCNRAAVYNYANGTWSFMDLPNVTSATTAAISTIITSYANASSLDYSIGGSYASQEAGQDQHVVFVGNQALDAAGNAAIPSTNRLYGLDDADGGTLTAPFDTESYEYIKLERTGIDLDQMASLNGYKVITKVTPQISGTQARGTFNFAFAGNDLMSDAPDFSNIVNFDPLSQHKIDVRASGRYLSYSLTYTAIMDFNFVGFDAEIKVTGRR